MGVKIVKNKNSFYKHELLGFNFHKFYNGSFGWYALDIILFTHRLKIVKNTSKELEYFSKDLALRSDHLYSLKMYFSDLYVNFITNLKIKLIKLRGFKEGKKVLVKVKDGYFVGTVSEIGCFNSKLKYNSIYVKVKNAEGEYFF